MYINVLAIAPFKSTQLIGHGMYSFGDLRMFDLSQTRYAMPMLCSGHEWTTVQLLHSGDVDQSFAEDLRVAMGYLIS